MVVYDRKNVVFERATRFFFHKGRGFLMLRTDNVGLNNFCINGRPFFICITSYGANVAYDDAFRYGRVVF